MNYRSINTDRQFRDATGYDKSTFQELLHDYSSTYYDLTGQSYEDYLATSVMEEVKLGSLGDALFFVLFQMKNDLIWGSLGAAFNMSRHTRTLHAFQHF